MKTALRSFLVFASAVIVTVAVLSFMKVMAYLLLFDFMFVLFSKGM